MKDDLISRQAVIDMLQSHAYDDWNQGASTTWANAFSECAEMIRNLPPAFCPNCGADMRGEEDERLN